MSERYYSDSPKVDFDSAPEMAPYLAQPDAMYIGCPGKHGYLNLGFELDADGKSVMRELNRRAPLIVQQELYFDESMPEMPCVYILSSGGPNVDGDRYVQNFTVHKDAFAHISTGAATKLAEMKRNYSGMTQKIVLEEGAYLEYLPEPVIPCRHTRFICDTEITVHPTASMVYSEVYMGGRKYYRDGELFEFDILSVTTRGQRPDGRQLFREKFIIDPQRGGLRLTGVMDCFDIFANVVVVTPPDKAAEIYAAVEPFIDRDKGLAAGITHLPNEAGLLYKVLGKETGPVKALVREFASKVRQAVKGRPIPPEFPWR
ncbi:MAG: urease accessory protein UreD [Muribaculaceae bacterium]|nr:urease accessory protein UreD [Muribaculaceae bacterium]